MLLVTAGCASLVGLERLSRGRAGAPPRFFIPGELGREARHSRWSDDQMVRWAVDRGGRARETSRSRLSDPPTLRSSAPRPSGFVTRAFSGLRGKDAVEWGRENGLTPSFSFSHNLTRVFPPELYRRKPEFFPLVEGRRLEPPKGSYFWNPDIAREDAAIHAADVARQHFETHPRDISFALGVNDALVWGESPELLGLLAKGQWQTRAAPEGRKARLPAVQRTPRMRLRHLLVLWPSDPPAIWTSGPLVLRTND